MNSASESALAFVAAREGCSLVVFKDTHLLAVGFGDNDPTLNAGDTITMDQAIQRFLNKAAEFEKSVNIIFPNAPQKVFDAMFSAIYNVGPTGLRRNVELVDAVTNYINNPTDRHARDKAAYRIINLNYDKVNDLPFNMSRRCREALILISADYGDISSLALFPAGSNPATDHPTEVPMPKFRR